MTQFKKSSVSKKLAKYTKVMSISISDSLVYVFDVAGRIIFFFVIMMTFLFLWKAIFGGNGGSIDGFNLQTMIWYLLVTETIMLSGARFFPQISEDVKTGNVAYMLNKPYSYVFFQFATHFAKVLFSLVQFGVVAVVIGLLYVGPLPGFRLYHIPFVILVVILGSAIDFFINLALALSAFWVEENMPFRWIYQKLVFVLGGMLLPLDMFPDLLKNISAYLPFAFVTYSPAKLAVDFSLERFAFVGVMQAGYLLLAVALAVAVFNRGVKGVSVNGG